MSRPCRRFTPLFCFGLIALAGCRETISSPSAPESGSRPLFAQGDGDVWTVNTLDDPGEGTCDDAHCTLREAIAAAAAGGSIVFASGLSGSIALATGHVEIAKSLTIDGGGRITLDAHLASRVVYVHDANVTLAGLRLTGGQPKLGDAGGQSGAGVLVSDATVTLDSVRLDFNDALFAGGGIYVEAGATATIENSHFDFNFGSPGGAIANDGTITLVRSTLFSNDTGSESGQLHNRGVLTVVASTIGGSFQTGIFNTAPATAVVDRSTIAGNVEPGPSTQGAGIHNLGTLDLRSSTVADNIAPAGVGGIYNGGTLRVRNSIVARNNGNPECGGPIPVISLGHNVTTSGGGCAFAAAGDVTVTLAQVSTDVLASAAGDNGGPTPTIALLESGLAVDAGSCTGETTDQRGFARPADNPLIANATDGCDIGAFEVQLTPAQQITSLSNQVAALSLPSGTATSLRSKLKSMAAYLEAGDTANACSTITAFINEVRAQAGKKKISASDANALISQATELKTALGCP